MPYLSFAARYLRGSTISSITKPSCVNPRLNCRKSLCTGSTPAYEYMSSVWPWLCTSWWACSHLMYSGIVMCMWSPARIHYVVCGVTRHPYLSAAAISLCASITWYTYTPSLARLVWNSIPHTCSNASNVGIIASITPCVSLHDLLARHRSSCDMCT